MMDSFSVHLPHMQRSLILTLQSMLASILLVGQKDPRSSSSLCRGVRVLRSAACAPSVSTSLAELRTRSLLRPELKDESAKSLDPYVPRAVCSAKTHLCAL